MYETFDDFLAEYKDSGLLDAFNKVANISDFRPQVDHDGNPKEIVEAGVARTMGKLTSHSIKTQGLMKLPKI